MSAAVLNTRGSVARYAKRLSKLQYRGHRVALVARPDGRRKGPASRPGLRRHRRDSSWLDWGSSQLNSARHRSLDLYYWLPRLSPKPYASVAGSVLPNVKYCGDAKIPFCTKTSYFFVLTSYLRISPVVEPFPLIGTKSFPSGPNNIA